jgi:chromosome segregation ATPase
MSEIAKKEKARRVWRLNKKEGVPVLEALETVDISKDVYYRIKGDWEDEWEEEILTVEQIQKRLAEVDEKLEKREKKLEQLEDRILEARRVAGDIDSIEAVRERATEAVDTGRDLEDRVERLEIEADITTTGGSTVGQLKKRVRQLEEQNLPERVNRVERVSKSANSRAEKNTERISRVESEIPESIWELM